MIFNKKYDDVLWLIVKGSKNEGKEIVNFLKYIPQELLAEISENLKTVDKTDNKENLYGEVMAPGGLLYWYRINRFGLLEIGERFMDNDDVVNLTYFYVYPLNVKEFSDKRRNTTHLGGISYHYDQPLENNTFVFSDDITMFSLIKGSLGIYRVETYEDKPRYNRVNINNIPDDININDLDNAKKLVRIKKNSK